MANTKGTPNLRNNAANPGKQSFLPPRSPFPTISQSYADYGTGHSVGSKGVMKSREGHRHHQRTTSESFLIEEQPSWLDDLLNEPETPVKKGVHRRSSSDSFACLDVGNMYSSVDNVAQVGYKNRTLASAPSWGSEDFDYLKDVQHGSYYEEVSSLGRPQNKVWESAFNSANYLGNLLSPRNKSVYEGSSGALKEAGALITNVSEKQTQVDSSQDIKTGASDPKEVSQSKNSQSMVDQKRVKQQFAQRSRVRKLQYIAELERHVQTLQVERSEVSAEVEFVDQQNLILNLENKTLKQRLDNLQHEHDLKCFQHEMLEREIARLRALYFQQQQQQQPQQQASPHVRSNSRDLTSQFSNLSLKQEEASSGREPFAGSLRS